MDIRRSGTQPSGKGPAECFTGSVRIDPLFQAPEPARALGVSVDGKAVDWMEKVTDEEYRADSSAE